MIFLANTLVNVVKPYSPHFGEWFFRGVELCILVSGVVFTTAYANYMKKKRGRGGEQATRENGERHE
jgi:hypothetical protein